MSFNKRKNLLLCLTNLKLSRIAFYYCLLLETIGLDLFTEILQASVHKNPFIFHFTLFQTSIHVKSIRIIMTTILNLGLTLPEKFIVI